MKIFDMKLVWFTAIYLFVYAILVQLDLPSQWLFLMMIFGQLLLIFTVYKVLKDHYTSAKTFKDWYEDKPLKQ